MAGGKELKAIRKRLDDIEARVKKLEDEPRKLTVRVSGFKKKGKK